MLTLIGFQLPRFPAKLNCQSVKTCRCLYALSFFNIAGNGLQLGEVAEIEAQMFSFAQKLNRRTAVEFSTKPAILPNCCYGLVLF